MADWPAWRRDPSVYLTPVFTGVLLPFLHRLHPEPDLVDGVVARLAEVPGVLTACRDNLDPGLSADASLAALRPGRMLAVSGPVPPVTLSSARRSRPSASGCTRQSTCMDEPEDVTGAHRRPGIHLGRTASGAGSST
ncbi:MAG: hypothetical protein ACRDRS_15365 [Pseudonocardiaceae bacterium]